MKAVCVICTDQFSIKFDMSACPCGHIFHSNCLNKWLKTDLEKTCPQCRKEVSETTQLFFSEDDEKDEDELEKQQLREFVNQAQMLLDNNDAQKRELEKNISQMEKMLSNKSASGFNQDIVREQAIEDVKGELAKCQQNFNQVKLNEESMKKELDQKSAQVINLSNDLVWSKITIKGQLDTILAQKAELQGLKKLQEVLNQENVILLRERRELYHKSICICLMLFFVLVAYTYYT